ncbi:MULTISPECIES: hypothetical protein [Achromobacter]|uniref:Uncharacterized protein n=1 Tax=Achromobacter mucicolens TaxID=1389922 RepID=A0ABM8LKT5_9BURK|nr:MULTISPECIES: hypothetical protein [Achromobacter]AVG44126.1 hypothetical protein MC81_32100 [Achromobacter insolitus]CAB3847430.1 hypothetical protein LMG3410_01591 [Achromobacter aegrifaciens]CAB3912676.1 hypothetical protein LMG3415_05058 [Achromobacter mucicolens]
MKQKNTMQSDPRQLDLFAVAEEIFGTHFILEASPTAALQAPEETREKIYNMHGPILELTAAEEDRFHKGGFRKLAASMLMGAIDDVLHAITPESKTAALAYFTEADGPFPFETVLDWLGPPLDHFTPAQWATRISEDASSASAGIHRYWRAVEQQEADLAARAVEGGEDQTAYIAEAQVHLPRERWGSM